MFVANRECIERSTQRAKVARRAEASFCDSWPSHRLRCQLANCEPGCAPERRDLDTYAPSVTGLTIIFQPKAKAPFEYLRYPDQSTWHRCACSADERTRHQMPVLNKQRSFKRVEMVLTDHIPGSEVSQTTLPGCHCDHLQSKCTTHTCCWPPNERSCSTRQGS